MKPTMQRITRVALVAGLAVFGVAAADEFDADWFTVDVAGEGPLAGADYALTGTIGQPDASAVAISGADYELIGGFWAVPACWCPSDLNNDGLRNGIDVQTFVECLIGVNADCVCADVRPDGVLNADDVAAFAAALVSSHPCP